MIEFCCTYVVNQSYFSHVVRWVQEKENELKIFYDLVVRFRDDTYAFGPWIIDSTYLNYVTSLDFGSFRGINDHNIVIDRIWLDDLFRGLIEDYYFNHTKNEPRWDNAEQRIFQVCTLTHTHTSTCIYIYIHTHIYICIYTYKHTHTHIHIHIQTHTHTHR